eukprot:Polyplicarium_translucidae@DN3405_c1_g1_i2.p3
MSPQHSANPTAQRAKNRTDHIKIQGMPHHPCRSDNTRRDKSKTKEYPPYTTVQVRQQPTKNNQRRTPDVTDPKKTNTTRHSASTSEVQQGRERTEHINNPQDTSHLRAHATTRHAHHHNIDPGRGVLGASRRITRAQRNSMRDPCQDAPDVAFHQTFEEAASQI